MQEECVACASLDFRAIKWEEIQVELLLRDSRGGGRLNSPEVKAGLFLSGMCLSADIET